MKIITNTPVYDAAKARIARVMDGFETIFVSYSGGKDSEVIFNLVLDVAREKGRLPINVLFIDQESEYDATIERVEAVMTHPDVIPHWLQFEFQLYNATNKAEEWFIPWEAKEEAKWVRPRHPLSIKENKTGTNTFGKLFDKYIGLVNDRSVCNFGGVRAEESPARHLSLTTRRKWKDITWGKCLSSKKQHFTFYPIYDWSYTDVWKYLHDNDLPYNRVYDMQFQHGIKVKDMRVSSLIHETALKSIEYLKEVEPENYDRMCNRITGVNTERKVGADLKCPKHLPYMFKDWAEYRDYLLEKLIQNDKYKLIFQKEFERKDPTFGEDIGYMKVCVESILKSDFTKSKLANYFMREHWTNKDKDK